MVAAWMSAETGVGPSMASGSQTYSGIWADLPMAPMNSSTAMAVAVVWATPGDSAEDLAVVQRAEGEEGEEHRHHEAEVTDAVGDEGLLAGAGVGVLLEPERDQQVGARAHALPAEEGEDEVVAQHQHQHREDEEVQVGEEPREAAVAVHVPDRVQVDQRADAGDEQDHRHRQRIEQEPDVDREVAGRDPGEQRELVGVLGLVPEPGEHDEGDEERQPDHGGGEPAGEGLADALAEEQQDAGSRPAAGQGSARRDRPWRAYPLSSRRSSAVAPGLRREMATMMAEARPRPRRRPPRARRTRSPGRRCRSASRPNVTKVRFTALSISSTHMNITSGLRRTSSPTAADGEEHGREHEVERAGGCPSSVRALLGRGGERLVTLIGHGLGLRDGLDVLRAAGEHDRTDHRDR